MSKILTKKCPRECRVVPLNDIHLGAPSFRRKAFEQTIDYLYKQAKCSEPVYWTLDGDCIENIVKECVASHLDQTMSPTEQVEEIIKYLEPIKHKGLFIIDGNHAGRTRKQAYYDIMANISKRLNVPYLGTGGYFNIQCGKQTYTICTMHGDGAAQNWELEIKRMAHNYPDADIYLMGHDHSLHMEVKPHITINKDTGKEIEAYKLYCRTGNYLGFAEYAKKKSYEMKPTGSLNLKFHHDRHLITGFPMIYINDIRLP